MNDSERMNIMDLHRVFIRGWSRVLAILERELIESFGERIESE